MSIGQFLMVLNDRFYQSISVTAIVVTAIAVKQYQRFSNLSNLRAASQ